MLKILKTEPPKDIAPAEACEFSKMSMELLAVFHAMNSEERTRALHFAKEIVAGKSNAA